MDVANATWANTIGNPELITVWTDPDFDVKQRAFYHDRVLEILTPRWTAHDAKHFGLENLDPGVLMVVEERAYRSPIWYAPGSRRVLSASGQGRGARRVHPGLLESGEWSGQGE